MAAILPRLAPYHRLVEGSIDPRVDTYIDALPEWQAAICREVRELIHEAEPEIVETIKRTVQPYFVFLYGGSQVPDPHGIVTAGHGNATGRQISIYRGQAINRPALLEMLRRIIADNRAGGWRKLERERSRC